MKLLIIIFLVSLLYGCDIFNTREPEEPSQQGSSDIPATEARIVIINMRNSFREHNVQNYLRCFVDSNLSNKTFSFSPSAAAISKFPILIDNWQKSDEERYFINLMTRISNNIPVVLSFADSIFSPQGDSTIFTSPYSISTPHNASEIPVDYAGEVRFHMIRDNTGIWRIYFWQDIKNTDEASWSELKGWFY